MYRTKVKKAMKYKDLIVICTQIFYNFLRKLNCRPFINFDFIKGHKSQLK